MLVTVTLPAVRSFDVTVSVQVAPSVAPFAGSRGKKFRNEPMICASNWAGAVVSDATALRNSPVGRSRPMNDRDRKSTRLNSSHGYISYAVFCLKKKHYHYTF